MNVALTVAEALQAASIAELDVDMQIGRGDAEELPDDGLWSIVQEPGTPAGGNMATWKEKVPVQVRLALPRSNTQRMFDVDAQVKAAIMAIPTVNEIIPSITCSSVGDFEADVAEARVGVWNVEATVITDGRTL